MVSERVVRFGGTASLAGVLSEPVGSHGNGRPGFLILNAGVLHHVGPARLHVRLARKLAAAGFTALRFDFSGIGDSEPSRDNLPFDTRAIGEIQAAMDHLRRTRGVDRFVLFGLCSGADAAFLAAKADARVVGHVSIDGFAYRTAGYYLRYYGSRLLRARSWLGFVRRHLRGLALAVAGRSRVDGRNGAPVPALFVREFPPRQQAAADLAALADRGVYQFFIYSGGHERWYNHAGQFESIFRNVDFRGRLRVRYFGDSDHTFPDLRQQDALTTMIRDWARGTWAADAARSGASGGVGEAPRNRIRSAAGADDR